MAELVLIIQPPDRHRPEFRRFSSERITIGRALTNDVILPDPYVSGEQAVLRYDPEHNGWWLEECGGENPLWINDEMVRESAVPLVLGQKIMLGKTMIRAVAPDHRVAPARLLRPVSAFVEQRLTRPWFAVAAVLAMLIYGVVDAHMMIPKEQPVYWMLIWGAFWLLLMVLVWSSVWAFAGRLVMNRARFFGHVAIAALFIIVSGPFDELGQTVGYLTSSPVMYFGMNLLLLGLLAAEGLNLHLSLATHLSRWPRIWAAGGIAAGVAGLIVAMSVAWQAEFQQNPQLFGVLKPPVIRMAPGNSAEGFLKKSDWIFEIDVD